MEALNGGEVATVNLVESLALDQGVLLRTVAEDVGLMERLDGDGRACMEALASRIWDLSFTQRMRAIAEFFYSVVDGFLQDGEILERLATHESDMVRSWVPFVDACDDGLSLEAR